MVQYAHTVRASRRSFNFVDYLDFARAIEDLPSPSVVYVDLSHLVFAQPSGMAPLIAAIQYLSGEGWTFDVALPDSDFLHDYFAKAGWISGITGDIGGDRIRGTSYVPLSRYQTNGELNELLNEGLEHFSRQAAFGAGVLEGLEWALNEIAGNVLDHAGGVPGWLQVAAQPKKGLIEIAVVDCGRGITASLRERFSDLHNDKEAVERAVEKGVTRDQNVGQGNGLAGTLRIAMAGDGFINVHSGSGLVRYLGSGRGRPTSTRGRSPSGASANLHMMDVPKHQGTVVTLTLPTRTALDVTEALWGERPVSHFEIKNFGFDVDVPTFRVCEEATGFGNRPSARPARQKLENFLRLFPNQRVVVDFDGVNIASASFLDEFLARLAKNVGITTFFQRIAITNTNDFVRTALDAVMAQRLAS